MNNRIKDSLVEILETIIKSKNFIRYMSKDEFASDDKSIFAIVRYLEIVGLRWDFSEINSESLMKAEI